MNRILRVSLSMMAAAALASPACAQEAGGSAKVPEVKARAAASARVPGGTVKSEELEREGGRLIYSYDIVVPGRPGIEEVHVDANTGAVLSVEHEGPAAEAAEAGERESMGKAAEAGEHGEGAEAAEAGEHEAVGEAAEAGEHGEAAEAAQAALRRQARLTEAQALSIAAKKVPAGSRVKASELENEDGHLIYSFEFVVPGKSGIQEVNVDARSGQVVSVEHENG